MIIQCNVFLLWRDDCVIKRKMKGRRTKTQTAELEQLFLEFMRYNSSLICLFGESFGYFSSVLPICIKSLCELLLDFRVKQASQYESYMNFFFQHCRFFPQSISQKHHEALVIAMLFELVKRQEMFAFVTCGAFIYIQQLDFSALPSHCSNLSQAKSVFPWAGFIPIAWCSLGAKMVCTDNCCISAEPHQLLTSW